MREFLEFVVRQLVEPERRPGVAQRGPQRPYGQGLPDVRRRVVDVVVLGELAVGLGADVPVTGVGEQDDLVAVPLLTR